MPTGLVVAPGFVDIHTHLDAQVFWDPWLTPTSLHGITTVVGGNCGFSIAPLTDADGDYVMRMLARVEGMPLESLRTGVPWGWSSTSEYLDAVDRARPALNMGFMAGHSTIRRVVMGDAAAHERAIGGAGRADAAVAAQRVRRRRDRLLVVVDRVARRRRRQPRAVALRRRRRDLGAVRRRGRIRRHADRVHPVRVPRLPRPSPRPDDQDVAGVGPPGQLERAPGHEPRGDRRAVWR